MTQHTKKLLILGAFGVAGFVLWQRFSNQAQFVSILPDLYLPNTGGVDAMALIDEMLQSNPLKPTKTAVYGINPEAAPVYL